MAESPAQNTASKPRRRSDEPDELSRALLGISDLLASPEPQDSLLAKAVRITAELLQMPICSVYLLDGNGMLRKRSNVGLDDDVSRQARFKVGEGIPGWVAQNGRLVAVADITQDPRYAFHPSPIRSPHAYICAPLRTRERIIGVLSARIMASRSFTRTECRVFQAIATMIAIVIEKQRLTEEKLRNENLAAVATSLSEVAHYVKNVMFASLVAEKLVGRAVEDNPSLAEIHPAWGNLKRSNQRIRKLVGDMLAFSRERPLELEETDVASVIGGAVSDISHHAARHGVELSVEIPENLCPIVVDRTLMSDVLLNLLSNAVDAIPPGRRGLVAVRAAQEPDGRCSIEVQDNGTGMPDDVASRVFQIFFSTKGDRGTGIGLAATKKAVERHGGTISFNTRPEHGTTFRITLPCHR